MINFITQGLPKSVNIGDTEYLINTDFRVSIQVESAMRDTHLTDYERLEQLTTLYYPLLPSNMEEAVKQAIWFYSCGKSLVRNKNETKKRRYGGGPQMKTAAYSFNQDASYIYAAFMEQYRIDLTEISYLHWWKFAAMFESLNDETQMSKIIYYRTVNTAGMSREQKRFINEMRKQYAILEDGALEKMTLAQRNERWKSYVLSRYEEK